MNDPRRPDQAREDWPALPLEKWQPTLDTLHMWTQMVGKVKLELCPFLNEWWNVAFQLTSRGLSTGPIPSGNGVFEIEFDFLDHTLNISASDRARKTMPLTPRSVADFYKGFMAALHDMEIDVSINPLPVEIPNPIRFDANKTDASYDPEYVQRWWRILVQNELVLQRFRTSFAGKSSPIQFFWGSFDQAHTRFSGRPATPPEQWPRFMQIAEVQENYACGFWPGNVAASGLTLGEPAYYAYAFPEPPGFKEARVRPADARYRADFGEFILPYDAVRTAADPAAVILAFLESTYEAVATLAEWDRDALESTQPKGIAR